VAKKRAKVSEKIERADREARERLEHADMNLFDRFMRKLVQEKAPPNVPPLGLDKSAPMGDEPHKMTVKRR
jgi:hypothetical protein